jgi:serine protease Do
VEGVGSGSGVIYTQDGYILTNHHVVSNGEKPITVTLFSGEKIPATYIYSDEANDVSVIKIEKSDCVYASISTKEVSYMMPVMVIGNALGRGFSTTQGVVSAPASEVYFSSTYETMTLIRVDAAINNGNSGGGLFNTAGQLIGIVNAKTSGTTSSGATIESMGYAIPMSTVMRCVNDLRDYGYVTGEARLGVNISNYISVGGKKYLATGMMVVSNVVPGGSAQVSGIKQNDILYKLNGERVESLKTLHSILTRYSVGDEVQITVLRPNSEAMKQTDPHEYLRKCDEITLTVKFTEFDPNK